METTTPTQSYRNNRKPGAVAALPPEIAGRLVPRAVEIEAAVLGALMLEKDAFSLVCDLLKPESFYEPRHAVIYTAIQSLGLAEEPIDMITVTNRLRSNGELEKVGGAGFVASLTVNVASAAHIEYHARIVAQKYLARELIAFASNVENGAFDESNDIDDLLQEAEGRLFEISQRNLKRDVTQIDPLLTRAIDLMQIASKRDSGISGLGTGFYGLDKLTSGWQNSDLIIIAARPAMGKTAFVDDTSGLSMMELRTKARRLVREHGIRLIVIDYLQLMTAGIKLGSREQEVSTISRSLKQLAKELDIPVIALSQLNRKLEDRGNKDKRPQLSDLRESGAIEQDADIVCFIHRPEYYLKASVDEDGNNIKGKAEFIVAKHRSGSTDTVDMFFRHEYVRFENWDNSADAQAQAYGSVSASDNADTAVAQANPEQAAADAEALGVAGPNDKFLGRDDGTPF